jgi:xanthine/CO dehydrogenase XdhC/CoxF family maturation factor
MATSIYEALRDALRADDPVALATVTEGQSVGAKLLVRPNQAQLGSLGDPDLDRVVARDALGELESGLTSTRHYGPHGEARERAVSVFIESFAPSPRMVIFGAVDFTAALVKAAKLLGYRVTVCDARAVFATRQRFPDADDVVNDWPDRHLAKVGPELGARDAVCVLTHDAKFDVPALVAALSAPWARAAPTPTGWLACATRASTTPASRGSWRPSASISVLAPPKRPRSLSAPRSSPAAPVGRRRRCATPKGPSMRREGRAW